MYLARGARDGMHKISELFQKRPGKIIFPPMLHCLPRIRPPIGMLVDFYGRVLRIRGKYFFSLEQFFFAVQIMLVPKRHTPLCPAFWAKRRRRDVYFFVEIKIRSVYRKRCATILTRSRFSRNHGISLQQSGVQLQFFETGAVGRVR